jgi:hypothetical protein
MKLEKESKSISSKEDKTPEKTTERAAFLNFMAAAFKRQLGWKRTTTAAGHRFQRWNSVPIHAAASLAPVI